VFFSAHPRFNHVRFSNTLKPLSPEIPMSEKKDTKTTTEQPYEPIAFAKKHRISVEDAQAIIKKYGTDRKSADKEARRVAV
jgi:hypothetical protein